MKINSVEQFINKFNSWHILFTNKIKDTYSDLYLKYKLFRNPKFVDESKDLTKVIKHRDVDMDIYQRICFLTDYKSAYLNQKKKPSKWNELKNIFQMIQKLIFYNNKFEI